MLEERKMRIFIDCLVAVKEVERDLVEMGILYESETVQDKRLFDEDKLTLELSGYAYKIFADGDQGFKGVEEMLQYNKSDEDFFRWVKEECHERNTGNCRWRNPGEAWKIYVKFWGEYIRDGKFAYTYVERIQEQLDYVVHELTVRPNSRQAVITIYDRHQDLMNWGGKDRVPCSLSYHFMLRNDKLSLIYSQRSCDFKKFFQADMYFALSLLNATAERLGVGVGSFTHVVNSLHMFKKDADGVF
jgi:thymidylate synthase